MPVPEHSTQGSRPIPDPTELTTDALRREISGLRELLRTEIKAEAGVVAEHFLRIEQQLESAHRETALAQKALEAALDAARRETAFANEASEKAISKAEAANEKRFEAFDSALSRLTDHTADLLPREVGEAQFAELRRAIAELTEKVGKVI